MVIGMECGKVSFVGTCGGSNYLARLWSEHSQIVYLGCDVSIRRDARIDVLLYDVAPVGGSSCRCVGENAFGIGEDANVSCDLTLGSERRRVLTLARRQRRNVVGYEASED